MKEHAKITKSKELVKWAKNFGQDLALFDPYVLNDVVDGEWSFSQDRLRLLEHLAAQDKKLNAQKLVLRE